MVYHSRLPYRLPYMVYPFYNGKFPHEIVANRGGRGVPILRHRSAKKVYCKVMIKNCNDMDIRVGLIIKWGLVLVTGDSGDDWHQVRAVTQFILLLLSKTAALPAVTYRSI